MVTSPSALRWRMPVVTRSASSAAALAYAASWRPASLNAMPRAWRSNSAMPSSSSSLAIWRLTAEAATCCAAAAPAMEPQRATSRKYLRPSEIMASFPKPLPKWQRSNANYLIVACA